MDISKGYDRIVTRIKSGINIEISRDKSG